MYQASIRKDTNNAKKNSEKSEADSSSISLVDIAIHYSKCHESYVQKCTIILNDGTEHVFGYDYSGWENTFCELYGAAYAAQWSRFISLIQGGETVEESEMRMSTYSKTFERLEQAAKVLKL